jgi:protein TonB
MQRILAAAFIAITFHAIMFTLNPDWLTGRRSFINKPPAITITMSYRKPPTTPQPPVKKIVQEIKKKAVSKPEIIKKVPSPVRVEEKAIEPLTVTEQRIDVSEDANYHEPSVIETAVVTESGVEAAASSEVITEAEPLYKMNPEPPYPKMARKRGYQGTVLLSVLVNIEGRVENLWVFESSGYNILDNAALEAVKKWIFEPGRQGDKPVDMWVEVPVKFEIR